MISYHCGHTGGEWTKYCFHAPIIPDSYQHGLCLDMANGSSIPVPELEEVLRCCSRGCCAESTKHAEEAYRSMTYYMYLFNVLGSTQVLEEAAATVGLVRRYHE